MAASIGRCIRNGSSGGKFSTGEFCCSRDIAAARNGLWTGLCLSISLAILVPLPALRKMTCEPWVIRIGQQPTKIGYAECLLLSSGFRNYAIDFVQSTIGARSAVLGDIASDFASSTALTCFGCSSLYCSGGNIAVQSSSRSLAFLRLL
jgi:hypothetical protein